MATTIAIATAIRKQKETKETKFHKLLTCTTGIDVQTLEDQFKENSTHD